MSACRPRDAENGGGPFAVGALVLHTPCERLSRIYPRTGPRRIPSRSSQWHMRLTPQRKRPIHEPPYARDAGTAARARGVVLMTERQKDLRTDIAHQLDTARPWRNMDHPSGHGFLLRTPRGACRSATVTAAGTGPYTTRTKRICVMTRTGGGCYREGEAIHLSRGPTLPVKTDACGGRRTPTNRGRDHGSATERRRRRVMAMTHDPSGSTSEKTLRHAPQGKIAPGRPSLRNGVGDPGAARAARNECRGESPLVPALIVGKGRPGLGRPNGQQGQA